MCRGVREWGVRCEGVGSAGICKVRVWSVQVGGEGGRCGR